MSTERFARLVGKATSRRRFLAKTGASALATALSLLGLQQPAHAGDIGIATVRYRCCNLCYWPSATACPGARCGWSWTCCDGGSLIRCTERYDGAPCRNCETAICSLAPVVGTC